ncbi:MAG: peptidylprolyl isomerase [Bryobacteraceae bacterium]|jgi:parvulin-like peptidyl-prolyl isomerase
MKSYFFIYAFLVSALSAQAGAPTVSSAVPAAAKPVARVNGAVLTDRDLHREMLAMFPYAAQHGGEFPKAMEPNIRKGALQMIVFEELLYQEALRRKMTVPAAQMDRAWAEFRKEFSTPEAYRQFLKAEVNGSEELARTKIRRSLLIEQTIKIEVSDKAAVSAAEAKAYYDKNPDEFRIPESFSLQTISMIPPPKAAPALIEEARKRAAKALKQAQAAKTYEQFGLLAEKISEDDYRVMLGDHKAVDRAKLPPPIEQALLAMRPGEISGVIQVEQTFTIVRLNAHIAAGVRKFDETKDSLRKQLEKNKTEQLRSALGKRLRAKAKIEEL